jgi:acyl carrier protein
MGTDVDCFSVESLKDNTARIVIEHSEIPMHLIQNKDGLFSCPGYEMQINGENSEGELYVGTGLFEGFSVWNFPTGIIADRAAPACPGVEVKHSFSIVDINKSDTGFPPIRTRIMKVLKKYNKGSSMEGSILEFDSLGIVELLVLLEEEFSFRVKVDEINRSEFLSVDSIVDFVTRKVEVTSGREGDIQ